MSDNNNSSSNSVALTAAQIEAKYLAEAKPHVTTLKSGTIANRPLNRKEFKEKFGLSNSDAKRLHAAHCAQWETQQKLALVAMQEQGFRIVKATMRRGVHGERAAFTLVRKNSDAHETLRQQIARLAAENAELKKQMAKA